MDKGDIIFIIVMSLLIGGCIIGLYGIWVGTNKNTKEFSNSLEDKGVIVTHGIIESPSVIISMNETQFLEHLRIHNITIVYYSYSSFYIFNEHMTIAYRYNVIGWALW